MRGHGLDAAELHHAVLVEERPQARDVEIGEPGAARELQADPERRERDELSVHAHGSSR
jgi:hypothetical protein